MRAAIVVPAFNAAATIAETLRAVQVCPGVAKLGGVFVCDDASTDNTPELAADVWTGIPKLTILQNEDRLGERRTVNAAFERLRAEYDWIFILHADDVVKGNWLDLYFQRIEAAGTRVASICSSYDCWYPDAKKIQPGEDDLSRDLEIICGGRESVLGTLKAGCWWHISGCAIRVDRFFEIGGFRPHMPQLGDFEGLLRCLKLGYDIEYIPRTTMLYRMHPASVSSNSFKRGQDLSEPPVHGAKLKRNGIMTLNFVPFWNPSRESLRVAICNELDSNINVGALKTSAEHRWIANLVLFWAPAF
jgi:glycosyltransferase involved in cell wall biosynthesis